MTNKMDDYLKVESGSDIFPARNRNYGIDSLSLHLELVVTRTQNSLHVPF